MGDVKGRTYVYKNSLEWEEERKGLLSSGEKPGFMVATPPEFKGHPNIWSPEDLFVASVNACIMTTFFHYAERNKLQFLSYKSNAEGILQFVGNKFIFSEIKIVPLIVVGDSSDADKARELIGVSEKNCLISNSIKSRVSIIPEIKITG
ncbi:MAG: OsmC family protein [Actinobacteria bacterium]|nr:OsmC family protein [Actinomycetota bacterium]